jgi:hypothetical protein
MYIHVCTMYRALCTDLQILVHVVRIPDALSPEYESESVRLGPAPAESDLECRSLTGRLAARASSHGQFRVRGTGRDCSELGRPPIPAAAAVRPGQMSHDPSLHIWPPACKPIYAYIPVHTRTNQFNFAYGQARLYRYEI